jgi:hypothetical protein
VARFIITDNVFENINVSPYNGDGHTLQVLSNVSDIVMKHNTVTSANGGGSFTVVLGSLPAMPRFVVHSNVFMHGAYGVKGGGTTEGAVSLNYFAPGYLFTNNVIVGSGQGTYPANTWWASSLGSVGFANLAGGDYHLSSSSPYLGKGYDGREVGADIDQVNAMTANAVVAPSGHRSCTGTNAGRVEQTRPAFTSMSSRASAVSRGICSNDPTHQLSAIQSDLKRPSVNLRIFAGTPPTTARAGTSLITTAFAPMIAPSPTWIGPRTQAPGPM